MQVMGITSDEQSQIFKLLAAILHLGNVTFKAAPQEGSAVVDNGGKKHFLILRHFYIALYTQRIFLYSTFHL
jgi:myosin heavy subunit